MRRVMVLTLLTSFAFGGGPSPSKDDQLIAVVSGTEGLPRRASVFPLARWRGGKMEDISHSWDDQEKGAWRNLPPDSFPIQRLMPFAVYAKGKKVAKIRPNTIIDWDCGPGSGLTIAEAPWPADLKSSGKNQTEWVAVSRPENDLGNIKALSEQDETLLKKQAPMLAIEAMHKKWPRQSIGKLLNTKYSLFPLDKDGSQGAYVHLEFEGPEGTSLDVSLVLDINHVDQPKSLYAEMGETPSETETMNSNLVGAFDLDGSGTAALLEETSYYEDIGYAILKRDGDHYIEVYRGSTYGE